MTDKFDVEKAREEASLAGKHVPCDCIRQDYETGMFRSECYCQNYTDCADAAAWCGEVNTPCRAALLQALDVIEKQREALEALTDDAQTMLDRSNTCGDPWAECPLQDAHKDYATAGLIKQARAALSLTKPEKDDG